ncbi:uncharacterized protein CMC5_043980 [Chondromyces crocatus]|uniref:FHA domain-containing protein n=2 Tax=Chondromyces crocatus TaxID=52 RepID=A0A0K1EHA5_CHOCO|nr:uncharacterized protein CMC5_043980 [Chondromyces crocatus]
MSSWEIEYWGHEDVPLAYFTGAASSWGGGERFPVEGSLDALPRVVERLGWNPDRIEGLARASAVISVGRRVGASVRIASSIVAPDHVIFFVVDERLFLVDVGSTNGTVLNGGEVPRSAGSGPLRPDIEPMRPYEVRDGDVITLAGGFHLKAHAVRAGA